MQLSMQLRALPWDFESKDELGLDVEGEALEAAAEECGAP
jgi:hypothetical protein